MGKAKQKKQVSVLQMNSQILNEIWKFRRDGTDFTKRERGGSNGSGRIFFFQRPVRWAGSLIQAQSPRNCHKSPSLITPEGKPDSAEIGLAF